MLRQWSLRRRLVAIVAIVAAGAILAVDVATYTSLQRSLLDRIDGQLDLIAQEAPPGDARNGQPPRPTDGRAAPAGTWRAVFRPDRSSGEFLEAPVDELVAGVADIAAARDRPELDVTPERVAELLGSPRTIESADGDTSFRVQARGLRDDDVLLVALPLTEYAATLDRLRNIELVVSLVAALLVALVSLATVRAGLRPLDAITAAAADIAREGDAARIGRRVPADATASSEIGQLAGALNQMLDRLDDSFAAQEAGQAQLRRFISDASHELRTPLTSIQGYAELARIRSRDMTDEEREQALLRVEQETEHVTRLVEDLLLLSRLDEGMPLHPSRIDVAVIAATSVDAARVIEPSRMVDIAGGSGPVEIDADPVRVRQLVDNLLANVRTHAGDEAAVIVRVAPLPGGGASLVVTDTGVGLPEGSHADATDRFWRADAARTRATGGSGLGLAIVRSIAEAHGGAVTLATGTDGRGLAVTVTLNDAPIATPAVTPAPAVPRVTPHTAPHA